MQTTLIDAAQFIGSIATSNNSYYTYLKNNLDKPVGEMTVSELIELHLGCTEKYNRMMNGEVIY